MKEEKYDFLGYCLEMTYRLSSMHYFFFFFFFFFLFFFQLRHPGGDEKVGEKKNGLDCWNVGMGMADGDAIFIPI